GCRKAAGEGKKNVLLTSAPQRRGNLRRRGRSLILSRRVAPRRQLARFERRKKYVPLIPPSPLGGEGKGEGVFVKFLS
ncbi:MAG: hypothetical protein MUP30_08705, partial [Deltaproteobacteria bacterium]|nr:hypothetical protein [Deltaproteobacteria bacterium]